VVVLSTPTASYGYCLSFSPIKTLSRPIPTPHASQPANNPPRRAHKRAPTLPRFRTLVFGVFLPPNPIKFEDTVPHETIPCPSVRRPLTPLGMAWLDPSRPHGPRRGLSPSAPSGSIDRARGPTAALRAHSARRCPKVGIPVLWELKKTPGAGGGCTPDHRPLHPKRGGVEGGGVRLVARTKPSLGDESIWDLLVAGPFNPAGWNPTARVLQAFRAEKLFFGQRSPALDLICFRNHTLFSPIHLTPYSIADVCHEL